MACPDFEDLLNGKSENHLAACRECRSKLAALSEIDSIFESAFAGISAPPGMTAAVRERICVSGTRLRPSFIPEFLDLIAWAAVLAIAVFILPRFQYLLSSIWAVLG